MKEKILNTKKTLICLLALVMVFSAMVPLSVLATDKTKNTLAVTAISNGTTSVGTTNEFAKAAGDSRVKKITLKNNIVFAEFQQFSRSSESDLTIDGAGKYSLRVSKSDIWQSSIDPTNHVSMEFKDGFRNVTFQNIALSGEAFNGFAYGKDGISMMFDNVNFDGPALVVMKNGKKSKVTIKDSTINLRKRVPDSKDIAKTWYLYPSEAAEIRDGDIILAGNVKITKIDPANNSEDHDEIFNVKGKEANLIIEPGANVDINNFSRASGSLYWAGLLWIDRSAGNVNFTIGDGAKFNFYAYGGLIIENYGLKDFTVGENAKVNMKVAVPTNTKVKSVSITEDNGSYFKAKNINIKSSAKVDIIAETNMAYPRDAVLGAENLRVNKNATLRVLAKANTVGEVLLKMHGQSPTIYIDSPEDVLLYNGLKSSNSGRTVAINVAQKGDSYNDPAKADIDVTFIGSGIRTWSNGASIPMDYISSNDEWKVNLTRASTWGTGSRQTEFTLKFKISMQNNAITAPIFKDPNGGLKSNPINASNGIRSFADKSVVQFNGSATGLSLTYDPNGGTGQATKDSDNNNGQFTIKDLGFKKTGHDFIGWNTMANGKGISYKVNEKPTFTESLTLYAQYKESPYITYEPNGGTGQALKDLTNDKGQFTVKDLKFKKADCDFTGWNTKADGSGTPYIVGAKLTLTAPLTLYAQYKETLYITYDPNGGTGQTVKDFDNNNGEFTVKDLGFKKNGSDFIDWNTKADGSGTSYSIGTKLPLTAPLTLYAQYKETLYITYDPNGGTGQTEKDFDNNNGEFTVKDLGFKKNGSDFIGWNTKADGSGTSYGVGDTLNVTALLTLYAQYKEILYIAYDPNGGTGQTEKDFDNNNGEFTVKDYGFEKTDYDFIGWNTEADGSGDSYRKGDTLNVTAPLTLYAQYAESLYIILDPNGGVGQPIKVKADSQGKFSLRNPGFRQQDYDFVGWNTERDGSGTAYSFNSGIYTTGPITLYAQYVEIWEK